MKNTILLFTLFAITQASFGQENHYSVNAGNGHGLRFWSSDSYKIHMGNSSEYKFGPVTDYSIKTNMNSTAGRGWTWGVTGATPIAALSNKGELKIAKSLTTTGFVSTHNPNNSQASVSLSWFNDIARIRVGGINAGASNGFQFQGPGESDLFRILGNGNIGIGTTNPSEKLQVNGIIRVARANNQDNNSPGITCNSNDDFSYNNNYLNQYGLGFHPGPNDNKLDTYLSGFWGVNLFTGGNNRLSITSSGNVGIGTTTPDAKLAVNGRIHTKEVKVDLVGWADYVFKDDYTLPTLEEVAQHIQEKGHLINIPSEAEVAENGIQLGEMNAKLLEKIEELTLYTIEQQEEINRLKKVEIQSEELEQRLAKAETLLKKITIKQ